MVTRAVLKYVRISPRKFRQIIPIVKGKNAEAAILTLGTVKKGASKYAIDLLRSAIANAKRMQGVDTADLYISNLVANCGPQLKRFRAGSMGRAGQIRKRTSHIVLELDVARAGAPAQTTTQAATQKAPSATPAAKIAQGKPEKAVKAASKAAKATTAKKGKE